jgi:hypothetical protein
VLRGSADLIAPVRKKVARRILEIKEESGVDNDAACLITSVIDVTQSSINCSTIINRNLLCGNVSHAISQPRRTIIYDSVFMNKSVIIVLGSIVKIISSNCLFSINRSNRTNKVELQAGKIIASKHI